MVGFGSSLRMSRRRGWEDAYLDYASLRLLLTQIEAVYEEEDWKRNKYNNNDDDNDNLNNDDTIFDDDFQRGINSAGFDEEGENAATEEEDEDEEDYRPWIGLRGLWRKKKPQGGGGPRRRRNRYRIRQRNFDDHGNYLQAIAAGSSSSSGTTTNNWVTTQSVDYHEDYRERGKKDKEKLILDKGGWRPTNTIDYRDELFIISDDDEYDAYYGEEDEKEEEDIVAAVDEEEDIWEDDIESNINFQQHDGSNDTIVAKLSFTSEAETPHPSPRTHPPGGGRRPPSVAEMFQMGFSSQIIAKNYEFRKSSTNIGIDRKKSGQQGSSSSMSDSREGGGEDNTPRSPDSRTPLTPNRIVEPQTQQLGGYETFAVAAARSGFIGTNDISLSVSPSEERGWFSNFIPNLLSKSGVGGSSSSPNRGSRTEEEEEEEEEEDSSPLRPTKNDGVVLVVKSEEIEAQDLPHRYIHFADTLHNQTQDSSSSSTDEYRPISSFPEIVEDTTQFDSYSFGMDNTTDQMMIESHATTSPPRLRPRPTTPSKSFFSAFKSSKPKATATMTNTALPVTPTSREQQHACGLGGFGVSLKIIPTKSSEPPSLVGGENTNPASQFYSFESKNYSDEYHSTTQDSTNEDKVGVRYTPVVNDSDHSNSNYDYEGGNEVEQQHHHQSTSSNNMISYFGEGGKDGLFLQNLRSPMKAVSRSRTTTTPSKLISRPGKESIISDYEGSGNNFILNLLCGDEQQDSNVADYVNVTSSQRVSTNQPQIQRRRRRHVGSTQRRVDTTAAAKRKQEAARLRKKKRRLRKRNERIPEHLRVAHQRAAAITERFRGLLRAEIEKIILFANSKLGELSDTIGSLTYSTFEDDQEEMRKKFPTLADGGMHQLSSSDSDNNADSDQSVASSSYSDGELNSDGNLVNAAELQDGRHRRINTDSSNETRKQIIMRDRLRISKPVFQKADFLGDDFSLLSAVDETDAYIAVGVELMHLLRYICVNIISVRKICRKHDRLYHNRMLRGYYQKLDMYTNKSHLNDEQQHLFLSNETRPRQTGSYYTVGLYDTKVQDIANCTTMQTVSSSLALALADFEASQSRSLLGVGFDSRRKRNGTVKITSVQNHIKEMPSKRHQSTRSRLKQKVAYQISGQCFRGGDESESTDASQNDDYDENDEIASTTSSNSALTRLRFVVSSIFGLREVARFKIVPFDHYSSRLLMISSGQNVSGEGLNGCSRETLDFLCSYQPDAAYTLNLENFNSSIKTWQGRDCIGGVMVASLAAAVKDYNNVSSSSKSRLRKLVASSLSINPEATGDESMPILRGTAQDNILRINSTSMVLYLANYYVIFPTAHIYSRALGSKRFAAALIGVANVSSLVGLLCLSLFMSKRSSPLRRRLVPNDFRLPLLLLGLGALVGNILFSYSVRNSSLRMALLGRLLIGLGSAEILRNPLLSTILAPESINAEASRLVKMGTLTIPVTLLLGSLVDAPLLGFPPLLDATLSSTPTPLFTTPTQAPSAVFIPPVLPLGKYSLLSLESVGYLMAFAWFIHLLDIVLNFNVPRTTRQLPSNGSKSPMALESPVAQEFYDSDIEKQATPKKLSYDESIETDPFISKEIGHRDGTFEKLQTMKRKTLKSHSQHSSSYWKESLVDIRKLMTSNVAFPTTVAVLFIVRAAAEIMLSSCGSIMTKFFYWDGVRSGLFLSAVTSLVLPFNLSLASERRYTQRWIMKTGLQVARYGLMLMVNYESIYSFIVSIIEEFSLGTDPNDRHHHYDTLIGAPKYMMSFVIVFSCIAVVESATLFLMSKVQFAPRLMKKYVIDNSFVMIFVSGMARIVGDLLFFTFQNWVCFNELINPFSFTMLIVFSSGLWVIRRHYFFLI